MHSAEKKMKIGDSFEPNTFTGHLIFLCHELSIFFSIYVFFFPYRTFVISELQIFSCPLENPFKLFIYHSYCLA